MVKLRTASTLFPPTDAGKKQQRGGVSLSGAHDSHFSAGGKTYQQTNKQKKKRV